MFFHYMNTSSLTPPAAATIKAAPDARTLIVGANSLTGLTQETTPGTWYFHYLAANAAGDSAVQTESYVISAGSIEYVGGTVIAHVGNVADEPAISLTSLTGGIGSAPIEGDMVIVTYGIGANVTNVDVAVTTSGYFEVADLQYNNGGGDSANLGVFYKFMTASPDTSVTVTTTTNASWAGSISIQVWRGVNSTSPMDVPATTATGTATGRPTPPPITPSTAGAKVVCCGAGACTTGADFTTSDLSNFITEYSLDTYAVTSGMGSFNWTSGTFTPAQWGGNSNVGTDSWCAVTMALQPA
jgi:hypothetical protein